MTEHDASIHERQPQIDFNQLIQVSRRQSTEVERQITISRYRTFTGFDFDQVATALRRCQLTAADDFGVINVSTSGDSHPQNNNVLKSAPPINSEPITSWLRAIFGIIGDKHFRWLDFESREIYEYMISGILNETFMTEYYPNQQNELEFLTYGGTQHETRIKNKHETCFGLHLRTDMVEFEHSVVKKICLRPEFKMNLKRIGYLPLGEDGYGTVDKSSMQTKYSNTIDLSADRVREILSNDKILIEDFSSRLTLSDSLVREPMTIRFDFAKRGRITLYLPKIDFYRPMNDVELERKFYEIVRNAYLYIIQNGIDTKTKTGINYQPQMQLRMDFESTLDAFLSEIEYGQNGINDRPTAKNSEQTCPTSGAIP